MAQKVEFGGKAEFWIDRDLSTFEQSFFRTFLINFFISRKSELVTYEARYLFEPSAEESEKGEESGTSDSDHSSAASEENEGTNGSQATERNAASSAGTEGSEATEDVEAIARSEVTEASDESASSEETGPPKQPCGFGISTLHLLTPPHIQLIASKLSLLAKCSVKVKTWPRHPPPPVGWDRLSDGEVDEDDLSAKHRWWVDSDSDSDSYASDQQPDSTTDTPETTPLTTPADEEPRSDWQGCDTDPRDRQNWQSRWVEDTPCETDIDRPQPLGPVYLATIPGAAEAWQDDMVADWVARGAEDRKNARWRSVYKLAATHAATYVLGAQAVREHTVRQRRMSWWDGYVSPLLYNTTAIVVVRYRAPSPVGWVNVMDHRLRRAFNF
ncbi:uncharacterized protein LOC62_06G007863 [Vanrija pseudolonga]|uniref:Uncharacterized protein n=1 Tax=Vanrija pseudolonga TaxID=143232 RepID=A0AAF1BT52_9TREE|nr:hypothetical protein LOC62_06G007863 [Vanrija pseudolonga]